MSVENEPIIPVQVKYIEVQRATVLKNEKIRSPSKTQEPSQPNGQSAVLQNGLCQSPVAAENIQVSHSSPLMSPCAGSPTNPLIPNKFQFDPNLSYAEKVAHEMIVTEKIYLENLKQIIDGFLGPVTKDADLEVSQENIDDLFINVEEIYQFNWILLQDMQKCNYDPVKLAECFVVKQVGFDIYTKYCTHYPRSMEVQLEWNQREDTANFIKKQQELLGHTLPLCSFLLKPVQRILKYHLLLGNIAKHFKQHEDEEGYETIQKALSAMTNVAKHINDMKRKHEDAVHLQEIQSVLLDYEGPNLTSFGSIVLEDTFRLHGTKTGRYLFLFEKALLITKRRSDGTFSWKATVVYSNMMLADSVFREPLTFQVIPFDDRKICYTFVSRDLDTKHVWLLELKKRLLDSYAAAVPMKAKQIILGHGKKDNEKENDEPGKVRKSSTRKGANQQQQLSKENSSQSAKLSKNSESDRRKSKDNDEGIEEKTKTSIDSFKSPLRRKLRVFKKRKFNKETGKSSKRVSWSSDDNNDDIEKELLTIKKQKESQERKLSPASKLYKAHGKEKQNIRENKSNNDNEVSISSLLRDGKTMVSVSGEEDNHLSEQVQLRGSQGDVQPWKKRRIAREKRQKCKSMPAGQFPVIYEDGEFLTVEKNDYTVARAHSLSHLYEKFLETEQIDKSVKDLQKYGLVKLSEHNTIRKRMGSYDEQLALEEDIHRSSNVSDVIPAQTDDVIAGQSVDQTMKRVSVAFSDISPNFTPEKSPTSSIEDITNEDITEDFTGGDLTTEDLTTGDLTPDEYTTGDLTPEEFTTGDLTQEEDIPGDLSLDDGYTGSPLPDEIFNEERPSVESDTVESDAAESDTVDNESEDIGKIEDSECKHKEGMENGVAKDWNGTSDIAYNHDSIYEGQSNQDSLSVANSEPGSCVDTLSDYSCDEQTEPSWLRSFSSPSYQRLFTLKRSHSEENLISKYPFNETRSEGSDKASKSYTHFGHVLVMRSKSEDCSKRSQSSTRPFTFSVTPKKKIVIKDSLWETIKEGAEKNHHEILVAKDVNSLRRRKKKRSAPKKGKASRTHSSEGRMEGTQHVVRTCAKLNMADYREPESSTSNSIARADTRTKSIDRSNDNGISRSQERLGNSASSNLPKKTSNTADDEPGVSTSQESIENNHENTLSYNSQKKTDNNPPVTKIAVALRKKRGKTSRDKDLVHVDENESEVPSTINYLCIETHPSDESPSSDGALESSTGEVKRINESAASKVERLSKYFNKGTTENKDSGKYNVNKQGQIWRKSSSIKKRVEELSKRETYPKKTQKNSEEQLLAEGVDLHSLQHIEDRIGVLRQSTSEDNHQMATKSIIELTSSLNHGKPNVKQLKNKLEEQDLEQQLNHKKSHDNGISRKVSTSLRIRNRIQELGERSEKKTEQNVDDDLRTCTRLKERIERLQKGDKRPEVDPGRDITICDDNDTSESPKQSEELRTLVIKRGWVQQFIQRIETGS